MTSRNLRMSLTPFIYVCCIQISFHQESKNPDPESHWILMILLEWWYCWNWIWTKTVWAISTLRIQWINSDSVIFVFMKSVGMWKFITFRPLSESAIRINGEMARLKSTMNSCLLSFDMLMTTSFPRMLLLGIKKIKPAFFA